LKPVVVAFAKNTKNKELILDAKEREKLELIMIARPEIRYSLSY
jgi:hypothetical protein